MVVITANDAAADPIKKQLVLQHVVVMHRHGDRSPSFHECGKNLYVSDEDKEFWKKQLATQEQLDALNRVIQVVGKTKNVPPVRDPRHGGVWPCGRLTQRGLGQLHQVGLELRERYSDLIGPTLADDDVYVQSTNYFRTLQSVQSLLTGLYAQELKTRAADAEPLYVHTHEKDVLAPIHPKNLYDILEIIVEKQLAENFDAQELQALRERVRAVLGTDPERPVPWTAARDILVCNRIYNVPYSNTIDDELVEKITMMDAFIWHNLFTIPEINREAFHSGFEEVYSHLEKAAKHEHPQKLVILSAHDSSILALLKALSLESPTVLPPYGAHVCLETYVDPTTKESYLKAHYNGEYLRFKQKSSFVKPFSQVADHSKDFLENWTTSGKCT